VPAADPVKRLVLGRALRNERLGETLLPKRIALPVFASDALSSNAYATQEILLVLALGGATFLTFAPWVAALVVLVFIVVVMSYRQNVRAYPGGGGDYDVVSTNLGPKWGVFVASALLIDYVLTVAVSISAAVANLGSTVHFVGENLTWFAAIIIGLIALMNLRGVRDAGLLFAIPSYLFMVVIIGMIVFGAIRIASGETLLAPSAGYEIEPVATFTGAALIFLVARAFSTGTTALTGIEAIANGVPAFREPKSRNAATTLLLLLVISMTMFAGITWLAITTGVRITQSNANLIGLPEGAIQQTAIVQVAVAVFSEQQWLVPVVAVATALILALAANTAFNGFPVLGSILARDGFLPRQLHTRGDRLAYSNGIIMLASAAILLVVVYQANVSSLIQLYILGVFTAFTLSQFGMIRHWTRLLRDEDQPAERRQMARSRIINSIGFVFTSSVLVIVLLTKFIHGAWVVVIVMPLLYLLMRSIRKHYERVSEEIATTPDDRVMLPARVHAIVLVSKLHKPTLRALAYARATRPTVLEAVTVDVDPHDTKRLEQGWADREIPVTLKILESPYREITRPILQYVQRLRTANPNDVVTVFVPEYVVGHWWEHLLHNQSALRLKGRLLFTSGVMVTSVPWQLESSDAVADRDD
jgi:amino acid transporter